MTKIKIGIVEDEVIIADHIADVLTSLGYEVATLAASFAQAIDMIQQDAPDILLLDIQLAGKNDGIDLALKVKTDFKIPFIFLTANADEATVTRAKLAQPSAYLVKPFSKTDLYTAIEICMYNNSCTAEEKRKDDNYVMKDAVFIKQGQSFHKIKFDDIIYIESEHVYIQIYTKEKKYLVRNSMQQFLECIHAKKFIRIHRSFSINADHLQKINTDTVELNGIELPVSKNYKDELFQKLNLK